MGNLPWWGVAILVVVGGMVFAVAVVIATRERREILANGHALVGWLVQANNDLFTQQFESLPAQVLISFPGEKQATIEQLEEIAADLIWLKTESPENEIEAKLAPLVRNEESTPSVRHLLPESFTAGTQVYSVHVMIHPQHLPGNCITDKRIYCKALPGDKGYVLMDEAAYAAEAQSA